jgi:hypothetical protein
MNAQENAKPLAAKKNWVKRGVLGFLGLCAIYYLLGSVWISPEIRAMVVEENGKPIQGAAALLVWTVKAPINETPIKALAIYETLTDADGKFTVPGWGPRFDFFGHLQQGEPDIYLYHPDFHPLTESNLARGEPLLRYAPVYIKFHKNGQTFQLQRFQGTVEERLDSLRYFSSRITSLTWMPEQRCIYQKFPHTLIGVYNEKIAIQKVTGKINELLNLEHFAQPVIEERCGDARLFFKGYLK